MKKISYQILSLMLMSFLLINCCNKDDINPYQNEDDYLGIWSVFEYSSNEYFDFIVNGNTYNFKRVHYYNPDDFDPDTLTTSYGIYSCDESNLRLEYNIYANQPCDSIVDYDVEYKNGNIELSYFSETTADYEYLTLIKRD